MINDRNEARSGHLSAGEAHVWRVALDGTLRADSGLLTCLSAEERTRLQRHGSVEAGMRFALTRLALRHILSHYTGVSAGSVALRVDERGKPELASEPRVCFSLSHAPRLALIAIAPAAVGIDIERERSPRRLLEVARRVLHPDTLALLARLEGGTQQRVFLDAWTQRESHVKAVGGGLFITPDALPFDMSQPADGKPYPSRDRSGGEWSVARFQPDADAHAALVARGTIARLRFFEWSADTVQTGE